MTSLLQRVDDYLMLRRMLGFKLRHEGFMLPKFARFVTRRGARITAKLALEWATIDPDASLRWWIRRLSMARAFAKFVHAYDPRTEIPPKNLLVTASSPKMKPYIFSDADVAALMSGARRRGGLRGATDATVLGLLAATGMRVGEAIGLDRSDVDWKRNLLVIRSGKFGKSRLVPLHSSTIEALVRYERTRNRALRSSRSPAFFLSMAGTRLHHQNFHHRYLGLLTEVDLATRHTHRPRLHDLRHSFIIGALVRWYRAGLDVEAKLASLSTYVGHVSPATTYWYLSATKDLLGEAARRLDRAQRRQP